MQNVMFSPQSGTNQDADVVAAALARIARTIIVVVLGISPLFFVPAVYAPFHFSKILFVLIGVLLALIFYSLSVLREGTLSMRTTPGLLASWGLAAIVLAAAAFSGDVRDALMGDSFGIHTAVFVALVAVVIAAVTILGARKASVMQLYILLTGSGLVLGLFHLVRFIFGPELLSFGVFLNLTATPLGGWNDLAIYFGLTLLLALVVVEQFPLTTWGRVLFGVLSALSLIMLAVVNFFAIWVVLGLVSLIVLIYSLTKNSFRGNTFMQEKDESTSTIVSVILSAIVFVVSMTFIVGGSGLGQFVSEISGVSYVEVRPSFEATLSIARNVYGENAFFGTGPNKFVDAWRQYKDPAINQTMFWDTPFEAGVGYIPTFIVTTGIFGAIAWLIFFGFLIKTGVSVLFTRAHVDRFWYFVGTSSFVSALYLWGMSFLYVPGAEILLLAAVFTGVLYTAHAMIVPQRALTLSLLENRRSGFALVAAAMIIIVGSVASVYLASRHYSALFMFNKAIASIERGVPIEEVEQQISEAYELSPNDRFAREIVGLQISKLNSMLGIQDPTETQQQQFQSIVVNAVNAAQLAVDNDPTEPLNWQSLGSVYSILVSVGIEGAYERASEAFENARQYAPNNPAIRLQQAQLESRNGSLDRANELAEEAVRLKPNYTDGYFFISQLDIARGDVEAAIESTRANITLEPRNPARYYQLGILQSAEGNQQAAATAFEQAVALDEDYANARYFLALAYDELGRPGDAREQLSVVLDLNPGNEDVIRLIERIDRGEPLSDVVDAPEQVSEVEAAVGEEGEVTTTEDPDSPLLSPVNTVPGESGEQEGILPNETSATEDDTTDETAADPSDTAATGTEQE